MKYLIALSILMAGPALAAEFKVSDHGAAKTVSLPASAAEAPRLGKYVCMSFSGPVGSFRWYLQLSGGSYQQKIPDLPAGRYSYNPATRQVDFTSGPYHNLDWMGQFSVEREGKTHRIVLRSRAAAAQGARAHEYANIHCTSSTDS